MKRFLVLPTMLFSLAILAQNHSAHAGFPSDTCTFSSAKRGCENCADNCQAVKENLNDNYVKQSYSICKPDTGRASSSESSVYSPSLGADECVCNCTVQFEEK